MFLPSTFIGHVTKYCYHVVNSPDKNNNIKKVYSGLGNNLRILRIRIILVIIVMILILYYY